VTDSGTLVLANRLVHV